MKFLLGILHPRRLDYFLDALAKIDYIDVLLVKNMELKPAIEKMKEEFLARDYDYLILTSDDTVIPYLAPAKIMQDVESLRYDVITGWSRINPEINLSNINTKQLSKDMRITRETYEFLTIEQIAKYILEGTHILKVWFVGWSLTAKSRKAVKNWTPIGWHSVKGRITKADLWFSYEMSMKGIDCYADLTVQVPHYPTSRERPYFRVGIEKPEVELIKAKKELKCMPVI